MLFFVYYLYIRAPDISNDLGMAGKAYLIYGQGNFSRGNMVVDVTTTKSIASFSGTRFNGRLGTAVAALDFNLE